MTDDQPTLDKEPGDELLDACLRKDDFFPLLVHELRNLVAPLGNAVQLMRLHSGADPVLQPAIQIMDKQLKSLGRAIDKLAAADHFRRGGVALASERIELANLVNSAAQATRSLIDSRKQRLHILQPAAAVYLEGDPAELTTVLSDLLENAANFAGDGGQIWLEAIVADDRVRVHVRDNGMGMRPELLSDLFDPLMAGSRSRPTGRQGLGLSLLIARKIVELHKGQLSVSSGGPGRGSEFVICLPLRRQPENNVGVPAIDPGIPAARAGPGILRLGPQRILVVDDSAAMRTSLGAIAQEMGHEVKAAVDGAAALELAREWLPRVVFLDINLPKLNGYQVARKLRSQYPATQMMLVMMSGDSLSDTVLRLAKDAGFDRCMDKARAHELFAELLTDDTSPANHTLQSNLISPN